MKYGHIKPDEEGIAIYWDHMFTHASWGAAHPLNEPGKQCQHLPLFLYADDVKWTNEEKLTQLSLGIVVDGRKSSMETLWPLFLFREARKSDIEAS